MIVSLYYVSHQQQTTGHKQMKQHIMSIHTKNGSTLCTPMRFALKSRCKRLKRELKANQGAAFRRWGM